MPAQFPQDSLIVFDDLRLPVHFRWLEHLVSQGLDVIATHPSCRWESVVDHFADRLFGENGYPTPRFDQLFSRLGGFVCQRLLPACHRPGLVGVQEYFLQRGFPMINELYHIKRAEACMEVSPNQTFEQSLLQRVIARQVDEKVAFQFVDQHKLYRK
jgi:hypothetical protein